MLLNYYCGCGNMVSMNEGNAERGNRGLVIVLVVLSVLILGLVVGNVIVIRLGAMKTLPSNDPNDEVSSSDETELPEIPYEEGTTKYYHFLVDKIINEDINRLRGEEVMAYATRVDEAEKSIGSAGLVIYAASLYNMDGVVNEYLDIYKDRMMESNLEYGEGGMG